MARVIFYEKPGCASNARQKSVLASAGHELEVRNLLAEPWTPERLKAFFTALPVSGWFNPAAPRVKSGEIDPASVDAETALALMLKDPLLIRRPLIDAEGRKAAGFDAAAIDAWLGLAAVKPGERDLESCRRSATPSAASAARIDVVVR